MAEPGAPPVPADTIGKITVSPDPGSLRCALARRKGLRRRLFIRLRQPANVPGYHGDPAQELSFHFNKGLEELLDELIGGVEDVKEESARQTLAEAQAVFGEPLARIDSAERRATTLQGTVAIAASLVVGGASLLIDPTKIQGHGWRIAIAVGLGLFLACLIGCAIRALGATSRVFQFEQPGHERITRRARQPPAAAMLEHAADLLRASSVGDEIAGIKVGLLRMAAWWFRCALIALAFLAGLLIAYAIADDRRAPTTAHSKTRTISQTVTEVRTVTVSARRHTGSARRGPARSRAATCCNSSSTASGSTATPPRP
jgi:hypothetical protein